MTQLNPKEFLANLELASSKFKIEKSYQINALQRAVESEEEGNNQAFVNDKSLISFVSNVNGQNRQDILNSTLLAQLAANKKYPNEDQMLNWYDTYIEVLQKTGWNIENKQISNFSSTDSVFEMENVIIDILATALGGTMINVIKETLKAFKGLSESDGKIIAFEKNTHSLSKGSFQMGIADETNDAVTINMGFFYLSTENQINRILFFKSARDKTNLK